METQNSNPQSEVRKMKPIVKLLIVFVIIAVVVAATVIFISVSIQKEKIAGTYYLVSKKAFDDGYYFYGPQHKLELTKDGKYIDEDGLVGTYTCRNGKITITESALGMTMRMYGTLEKGVLTYTNTFMGEYTYIYVKLDTPPENGQLLDKLPTEK